MSDLLIIPVRGGHENVGLLYSVWSVCVREHGPAPDLSSKHRVLKPCEVTYILVGCAVRPMSCWLLLLVLEFFVCGLDPQMPDVLTRGVCACS